MDFINETAKRCHGKPDDWRWYSLDAHNKPPGFFEVIGSVPVGKYRSGKRKGRPKWDRKIAETVWMKWDDLKETKRLWGIETGKCPECLGTGKQVKSVSVVDGTTYRPCGDCDGTGVYQEVSETQASE